MYLSRPGKKLAQLLSDKGNIRSGIVEIEQSSNQSSV